MQVVSELVATRDLELRRAYSDIIAVGYGLRTRTRAGKRRIVHEPCVTFMVRRKWPKVKAASVNRSANTLPPYLYAYCSSQSYGRAVCAVPTDVESAERYRAKAQRARLRVRQTTLPAQLGVVTCAVRLPGSSDIHLMSCHHVFAMSTVTSPNGSPAIGANAEPQAEPSTVFATLNRNWMGKLVPMSTGVSFDAALAKVSDLAIATQVIGPIQPQRHLDATSQLPLRAKIVRPGAGGAELVDVQLVKIWKDFDQIDYFDGAVPPRHSVVVEWKCLDANTQAGDSGAPVISQDGTTLLGMHIAGAAPDAAFMLPANQLFLGLNYGQSGHLELAQL